MRPAGQELLLAYFGGDYARELEAEGSLETAAREELVTLFGSYSAARPGCAHYRSVFARSVAERLFFAGDACTVDTSGAIHGAWASGAEAARRIVAGA